MAKTEQKPQSDADQNDQPTTTPPGGGSWKWENGEWVSLDPVNDQKTQ